MEGKEGIIYIVDDDFILRSSIEKYLNSHGYKATALEDGFAVIPTCQREVPDLIIADIRMPGIDRIKLLEQLRKLKSTQDIPVIFISAFHDSSVMKRAKELGANDFLFKPFVLDDLDKLIERNLAK